MGLSEWKRPENGACPFFAMAMQQNELMFVFLYCYCILVYLTRNIEELQIICISSIFGHDLEKGSRPFSLIVSDAYKKVASEFGSLEKISYLCRWLLLIKDALVISHL